MQDSDNKTNKLKDSNNQDPDMRSKYHESPAYYIWIGREDQDPYRVKT